MFKKLKQKTEMFQTTYWCISLFHYTQTRKKTTTTQPLQPVFVTNLHLTEDLIMILWHYNIFHGVNNFAGEH